MKTSMGLWDSLFGQKVLIELPQADGTTRKISVTKRWVEHMASQGRMTDVTESMVKVNVLDAVPPVLSASVSPDELMDALSTGVQVRVEHWRVGVDVPRETYDKFVDSSSKELYAMRNLEAGQPKLVILQRHFWEKARQTLGDL